MELTCARCGRKFFWTPTQGSDEKPLYHSPSCQKAASKERKAIRENRLVKPDTSFMCPTPTKVKHQTWISAGQVIDKVDISMSAYRCRCGWIHVGHSALK